MLLYLVYLYFLNKQIAPQKSSYCYKNTNYWVRSGRYSYV